jgi:hypothetical protein
MRERFYQFMVGRYGTDALNKFLLVLWIALAVVNIFIGSRILRIVVFALCVIVLLRTLSRNFAARQKENDLFLRVTAGLRGARSKFRESGLGRRVELLRLRISQRRTHCFFECPSCGAALRVPRRKGLMEIRCVRCGTRFTKKIR